MTTIAPDAELAGRFGGGVAPAAWGTAVGAVVGIVVIAGAAFWGYRTQTSAWPTPNAAAPMPEDAATKPLPVPPAASASRPAKRLAAAPVGTPAQSGASAQPEPLKWPIWEFLLRQPIPPRNPSLTPVPWRLIGATQSAGTWSIIVMRQGKTVPEYFKTGESLPGGYRVESITEEDVTLVKGNRPVTLSYIGAR